MEAFPAERLCYGLIGLNGDYLLFHVNDGHNCYNLRFLPVR